jgi:hypothetical protein
MSEGFFFPYRPIKPRFAPMVAPSRYEQPNSPLTANLPTTYNSSRHTVDCIIATGSPLRCRFGLEVLRISDRAVDLSLLDEGRLPLLDSHDSRRVLGRVVDCWIENRQLCGTLRFDRTPFGIHAERMVARGELTGISCHSAATRWTDAAGDKISTAILLNPSFSTWSRDDGPQTFTARRWRLNEVSLTSCPKDSLAVIL